MAKLETLKGEIRTVEELAELSNVLEQTAARDIAQMRERILESRQFFQEARRVYKVLQTLTPTKPNVLNKHLVVLVTLEWGMTGSLLNRVVRKAEELYDHYEADLLITGKMGRNRFVKRNDRTIHFFEVPKRASFNDIEKVNEVAGRYASVHFVYPKFESLSKQVIAVSSVSATKEHDVLEEGEIEAARFRIEPDPQAVVDYMNKAMVGIVMYNYFSEALLAYSAAQMIAMRSAYDNAKEAKKTLTMTYNKARREQIDTKLREQYGSRLHSETGQGVAI